METLLSSPLLAAIRAKLDALQSQCGAGGIATVQVSDLFLVHGLLLQIAQDAERLLSEVQERVGGKAVAYGLDRELRETQQQLRAISQVSGGNDRAEETISGVLDRITKWSGNYETLLQALKAADTRHALRLQQFQRLESIDQRLTSPWFRSLRDSWKSCYDEIRPTFSAVGLTESAENSLLQVQRQWETVFSLLPLLAGHYQTTVPNLPLPQTDSLDLAWLDESLSHVSTWISEAITALSGKKPLDLPPMPVQEPWVEAAISPLVLTIEFRLALVRTSGVTTASVMEGLSVIATLASSASYLALTPEEKDILQSLLEKSSVEGSFLTGIAYANSLPLSPEFRSELLKKAVAVHVERQVSMSLGHSHREFTDFCFLTAC